MGWGTWGAWPGNREGWRQWPRGVAEMEGCPAHHGDNVEGRDTPCWMVRGSGGCLARAEGSTAKVCEQTLVLVVVCRFGCQLQFPVCLIEQVLGVSGMTVHVPLIGLLRGNDFAVGLIDEALRLH